MREGKKKDGEGRLFSALPSECKGEIVENADIPMV